MKKRKVPVKRSGLFIGAYVPEDLKVELRRMATEGHVTVSKLMIRILKEAVKQHKGN